MPGPGASAAAIIIKAGFRHDNCCNPDVTQLTEPFQHQLRFLRDNHVSSHIDLGTVLAANCTPSSICSKVKFPTATKTARPSLHHEDCVRTILNSYFQLSKVPAGDKTFLRRFNVFLLFFSYLQYKSLTFFSFSFYSKR